MSMSRNATVPVEAVIEEEPESTLWRGETVLEPSRVTVSGPKSVVDRIPPSPKCPWT